MVGAARRTAGRRGRRSSAEEVEPRAGAARAGATEEVEPRAHAGVDARGAAVWRRPNCGRGGGGRRRGGRVAGDGDRSSRPEGSRAARGGTRWRAGAEQGRGESISGETEIF